MDGLKKVQVQLLDAESGEVLEDVNPHFNTSHVSINPKQTDKTFPFFHHPFLVL